MGEAFGALVAAVGFLVQQSHHDVAEGGGQVAAVFVGWGGERGEVVVDQVEGVGGGERGVPGGQVVEGRAQAVEVGAVVDGAGGASGLFGGQVGQGAVEVVLVGEVGSFHREGGGQFEVDQERGAGGREQEVARGDVAVHDPARVHRAQRGGHLRGQVHQLRHRQPPTLARQQPDAGVVGQDQQVRQVHRLTVER